MCCVFVVVAVGIKVSLAIIWCKAVPDCIRLSQLPPSLSSLRLFQSLSLSLIFASFAFCSSHTHVSVRTCMHTHQGFPSGVCVCVHMLGIKTENDAVKLSAGGRLMPYTWDPNILLHIR